MTSSHSVHQPLISSKVWYCATTSPYVKPMSCSSQWCWNTSCSYKNKLPLISSIETHFLQMNIQIKPTESPFLHFIQLNTFQQKKFHFLQTIFILSNWRLHWTHQMKETILQLISINLSSTLWPNSSYTGQQGTNTVCFILFNLNNLSKWKEQKKAQVSHVNFFQLLQLEEKFLKR